MLKWILFAMCSCVIQPTYIDINISPYTSSPAHDIARCTAQSLHKAQFRPYPNYVKRMPRVAYKHSELPTDIHTVRRALFMSQLYCRCAMFKRNTGEHELY